MAKTSKEILIDKIFSDKSIFEEKILDVKSNDDIIEVMCILSKRMIRVLLREELNFLYMKDLSHFKFSLIVNLLFKEIVSEWVSYAQTALDISQEDATEMMQEKEHVYFLLKIIKEYYKQYKIYFTQEIADTFIELVGNMPTALVDTPLIREVLSSGFVKQDNIIIIYNYSQLFNRVHNASSAKKTEITKIQVRLNDVSSLEEQKKLEYKEEQLQETPLAFFNEALERLRSTMVQYMMGIEHYPLKKS